MQIDLMRNAEIRAKAKVTTEARTLARILSAPFEELGQRTRKRRVLHEQNFECLECGIKSEWLGKPLMLHLDHIDGNNENNSRENLRCICPNCHSQTHNYAGRNWGVKKTR